jgi:erythromycin esterase-like protein
MKRILFLLLLLAALASCKKKGTEAEKTVIAIPSLSLSDPASIDSLVSRIGNARVVLLGEATHGTSEFYQWRAHFAAAYPQERL